MAPALPSLEVILLCERVLVENDGVPSPIRVVNQITVAIDPNTPSPDFSIALFLVLASRGPSGMLRLRADVIDDDERPVGAPSEVLHFMFGGDADARVNAVLNMRTPVTPGARYRYRAFLNDELIGESPLKVAVMPLVGASGPPTAPSSPSSETSRH